MADTAPQPSQADVDKLNQQVSQLQTELAAAKGKPEASDEDLTPTPTQEELDRLKRGETADGKSATYKTRQAKSN